jgi:putative ABC transport system permease protein
VFGGGFGPPTLVYNWIEDDSLRTGMIVDGRGPESDDEIALDFTTAGDLGHEVGDTVTLATLQEGTEEFELVGVLGLGEDGTKSTGAKPMFFTTSTAMRLVDQPDQFNFVAVAAGPGVTQTELADRLAAELPGQQVLTGEAFTQESQESISQFVDILGTFVSVFGWIALFVAIFIIYNTFSIIITQRTRETALLRAVGARRRQVLAATLLEALMVGLLAAALGLGFGLLLAIGLLQLVGNFFTVSSGVPPLTAGAVATALGVGVVVTMLSAFIPALRSSKIPPIAALTEASLDRSDLSLSRRIWGTALLLGGAALIGYGLTDPDIALNP